MSVAADLKKIKANIPREIKLVAVSKTKSCDTIMEAYHAGHRIFGENKVQELQDKHGELPKDIEWHFIGHLQTNKVKYIAGFVHLVHSVDSIKLLSVLNKEAIKADRIISCLLQIKIAREDTKYGLSEEGAEELIRASVTDQMKNIRFAGVMGMATYTSDLDQVRQEFQNLSAIFKRLKEKYFSADDQFKEISMGMSHDYPVAIEEGATLIRIGSLIFGERTYNKLN